MSYSSIKVKDLVDGAVKHAWSIPEFQRGFVWKPAQVRELAESLFRGFPVGSLLLWNSTDNVSPLGPKDSPNPTIWIVDGQQRTTALCLLLGRKPFWWNAGDWNEKLKKYNVCFDAFAIQGQGPRFVIPNAAMKKAKSRRYLPLQEVLHFDFTQSADKKKAQQITKELADEKFDNRTQMDFYSDLQNLCDGIRGADLVSITVDNELEDVVEIFSRLNSKGTRVTEADIYLGVVASRKGNAGWVRDEFLEFVREKLAPAGFDVGPNTVFRTLTAVGARRVRFKTIPSTFWDNASIVKHWQSTTDAWKRLIKHLEERNISSLDVIPSNNVLVPLVALVDKFPTAKFDGFFYWFLQATIYSRYSAASDTRLEEDLKSIESSSTPQEAVDKLLKSMPRHADAWKAEDFLVDYSDYGYPRLMLYLLVTHRKAKDWDDTGWRIGFQNTKIAQDFKPQWHHIFPRKYLTNAKVKADLIDAIANIAVIGPKINIRISAKSPMEYISKYNITADKLATQFVNDDITKVKLADYEKWLNTRAQALADATNAYLDDLRKKL